MGAEGGLVVWTVPSLLRWETKTLSRQNGFYEMEMGEGYNDGREKSGPYDLEWEGGSRWCLDGGCHRVVGRFFVLRARMYVWGFHWVVFFVLVTVEEKRNDCNALLLSFYFLFFKMVNWFFSKFNLTLNQIDHSISKTIIDGDGTYKYFINGVGLII